MRPFPGAGARVQVSSGGGTEPAWGSSGRTLFYRQGSDAVAVSVTPGAAFSIGARKVVLSGDYLANPSHPNWDVAPDGAHFVMLKRAGGEAQLIVVHNWTRELEARTASRKGR